MHKQLIRHEIIIHALPTKVWKVLTCSEYAGQFLFNEEFQSEWIKGSPIMLEVDQGGRKESQTKGMVHEVVPGISLQFTLYDLPLFSNSPVLCQYELVPEEGGIRLIVSQEVPLPSQELYGLMAENCRMMLQKIKWLAEYS
ncbi:MAG: SRPBCC family protein [Flavisolibacter sp.]